MTMNGCIYPFYSFYDMDIQPLIRIYNTAGLMAATPELSKIIFNYPPDSYLGILRFIWQLTPWTPGVLCDTAIEVLGNCAIEILCNRAIE